MRKALFLILPLLLASVVLANGPTLDVEVEENWTILTIEYSNNTPGPRPPLPALVFLAFGLKEGTTPFPVPLPFLPTVPEFKIEDAMIIPMGVLGRDGKLVIRIPFGSKARGPNWTEYEFLFQAGLFLFQLEPPKPPTFDFKATTVEEADPIYLPR